MTSKVEQLYCDMCGAKSGVARMELERVCDCPGCYTDAERAVLEAARAYAKIQAEPKMAEFFSGPDIDAALKIMRAVKNLTDAACKLGEEG